MHAVDLHMAHPTCPVGSAPVHHKVGVELVDQQAHSSVTNLSLFSPVQLGVCQPHEVDVQLVVQRAHLIGAHAAAFAKPTVYKHACRGWMVCVCHQISVSTRKTEENPEVHVHCNAPIFSVCVTML